MKKTFRKTALIITLAFLLVSALQDMTVFAAAKADLNISGDGTEFLLTKGDQSYAFRYDWNAEKKAYTGYDQNEVNKIVPLRGMKGLQLGVGHDGRSAKEDSIVVLKGVTLNKKLYYGMTLAQFHKKVKSAWSKGYYSYWNSKKGKAVRIGTKKPSNSYVQKRCKDTGLFWAGNRGRLKINCSIVWNKSKKRAEIGWTEIFVR